MPKKTNSILIKKVEYGVYRCESWGNSRHPHTVNLHANKGNGFCTCEDFEAVCAPNLRKNGGEIVDYGSSFKPKKGRTYCRHIKYSRFLWANEKLREESKICEPE